MVVYYFITGDAVFNVEGNIINIHAEDVLFIEKNTEYSFYGNFKAVLINLPAFGIEYDQNKK